MWEKLDNKLLICYALTTLAGIGLHFVFDLWPSLLTEFFAPVNESLWEHIKIIFWPYLLAGLYLTGAGKWQRAPWLATLLLICGLLLAGGYYIHAYSGLNAFAADIALYFFQLELLAVYFLRQAVQTPVFSVQVNLHKLSPRTVEHLRLGGFEIGVAGKIIPQIRGDSVAHPGFIYSHSVQYPRVVRAHSQKRHIEFVSVSVNKLHRKGFLCIVQCTRSPVANLDRIHLTVFQLERSFGITGRQVAGCQFHNRQLRAVHLDSPYKRQQIKNFPNHG